MGGGAILPTLATRDDVASLRGNMQTLEKGLRGEMQILYAESIRETRELVETASRRTDVLVEDLRSRFNLLVWSRWWRLSPAARVLSTDHSRSGPPSWLVAPRSPGRRASLDIESPYAGVGPGRTGRPSRRR
jgi:hypothetical protein